MKQNFKALISILSLISITLSSVVLVAYNLKILGCLIFCSVIWAWFSILHSCGHNAYFSIRKLNDLVGYIASTVVCIPFYSWKIHHATHHKWLGFVGIDPTNTEINLPKKEKLKIFNLLWKLCVPFVSLSHLCSHLWNIKSVLKHIKNSSSLKCKTIASFLIIVLVHSCLVGTLGFTFYLPWSVAILFFLLSSDVILLSQHALLPMKKVAKTSNLRPLPPEVHYRYTRSISFGYFIDRFVLLNFGEHVRHHRYPLKAHFDLPLVADFDEKRVSGWQWIKTIKKMHIKDVLEVVIE